MAEDDAGEKTEPASEKRRQEFREKGDIARSRDAVSVLILFTALAYFLIFGDWIYECLTTFQTHFLELRGAEYLSVETLADMFTQTLKQIAIALSPLIGGIVLVSILGNVAQVGVLWSTKTLEPKLDRLNFIQKLPSTFFSKQTVGMLAGSVAKMTVVGVVIYITLSGAGEKIRFISTLPLTAGVQFLISRCLEVLLNVAVVLIFIAIADYAWNRYVMEEKMKMTKQEVKDEQKEMEGSPQVKGQQRRRAQEIANKRMMADVPEADVIVNNPTHISVALRYRQGTDEAPIVVAMGADLMAMRIRRVAKAHGVPMVENVPLARGLYSTTRVGRAVPAQFFRAVAEVLAYVYRVNRAVSGQREGQRRDEAERT